MNAIDRLSEAFKHFPGIGPKQAKRFVYYLLSKDSGFREEIAKLITSLSSDIRVCPTCFRFFVKKHVSSECNICIDKNRNSKVLMIVAKDVDLEIVEKSGVYDGHYFVLGGTVPILDKNPEERIRAKELVETVSRKAQNGLTEIVVAMSMNPEGDHTGETVESYLTPILAKFPAIKISHLGRGLSTGTELEYSDKDTISYALKNRA